MDKFNPFLTDEKKKIKNAKESEKLFIQLMEKALTNEHSTFEFLRCWSDREVIKQYVYNVSAVITMFKNLEKTAYKTYLKQIESSTQDLQVVLVLKQFNQCKRYYQKEKEIAKDMLEEYKAYVFGGHLWDTLVGNIRTDEDCVDYRNLPWGFF